MNEFPFVAPHPHIHGFARHARDFADVSASRPGARRAAWAALCLAGTLTFSFLPFAGALTARAADATITLGMSADLPYFSTAATTITYSYEVANTGTSSLDQVMISDPQAGLSAISCPSASLGGGESMTCTASYETTEADVVAGAVNTLASVSATDPAAVEVTASTRFRIQQAALELRASAGIESVAPGGAVDYTVTVTNVGSFAFGGDTPATLLASLEGVLDDATYLGNEVATEGTVSYLNGAVRWGGALAPGGSASITYSVQAGAVGTGDGALTSAVVSRQPSNCLPNASQPACSVTVTLADPPPLQTQDPILVTAPPPVVEAPPTPAPTVAATPAPTIQPSVPTPAATTEPTTAPQTTTPTPTDSGATVSAVTGATTSAGDSVVPALVGRGEVNAPRAAIGGAQLGRPIVVEAAVLGPEPDFVPSPPDEAAREEASNVGLASYLVLGGWAVIFVAVRHGRRG